MKTKEVIAGLLKQNTGSHMLDSGGAYGRHWERNQERDFESEPECELSFSLPDNVDLTLNVYHWLVERLEYNEEADQSWQRFWDWQMKKSNDNASTLELMREFPLYWGKRMGDDDVKDIVTYNTYNGEDLLSQVLQYTYWRCNWDNYVLLQIHQGCDVRGGYTFPVVFNCDDYGIMGNAEGGLFVPGENISWYTDDAWHWYSSSEEVSDLKYYEFTEDETYRGKGKVWVDDDGNGYCPVTGVKIEGSIY